MLAILLALASAVGYGGSDFAAGLASREASVIRVAIVAETVSVVAMLLIVPWVSQQVPSGAAYAWSVTAGLGGMIGGLALYLGFRHAAFSVAGPLSAVASAAFSVLAGLAFGEHPGGLALAGIALALPAIIAVSASPASPGGSPVPDGSPASGGSPVPGGSPASGGSAAPDGPPGRGEAAAAHDAGGGRSTADGPAVGGEAAAAREVSDVGAAHAHAFASRQHIAGVLYGLAAGAGFAVLFIGLNRAGSGSDLWPALVAQATGLAMVCVAGAARGQLRLPSARASWLGVVAGLFSGIGTTCFFVATHEGLLAVTAVITSLYPAGTILLARVMLRERLTPVHMVGLGLAGASVTLIAVAGAGG